MRLLVVVLNKEEDQEVQRVLVELQMHRQDEALLLVEMALLIGADKQVLGVALDREPAQRVLNVGRGAPLQIFVTGHDLSRRSRSASQSPPDARFRRTVRFSCAVSEASPAIGGGRAPAISR